jgi:hypothetical protein
MSQAVPKEGVPEGRKISVDAPPEVFHAGVVTELDPSLDYGDGNYGPTGPPDAVEELPDEKIETPKDAEGGKEEALSVEATPKGEDSPYVPKERFNEVNERAKQYEDSHKMLQWVLRNPTEFAKMQGLVPQVQQTETAPIDEGYESLFGKPPEPSKPLNEMEDREVLSFLVAKEIHNALGPVFKTLGKDISGLKGFKTEIQDALVKTAAGPDGKPLYPRWDELRPAIKEVQQRYAGISQQEAYVLADKFSQSARPILPPQVRASAVYEEASEPKPKGQTRKPNLAVARANFMSNLGGRSGGALRDNMRGMDVRACVEKALLDIGFEPSDQD